MTKCLPQYMHCNGVDECGNQADEDNCGDNNGWSQQLDKLYEKHYEKIGINYFDFDTKAAECLLGSVPAQCLCRGLELDCDGAKLRAVPAVSSNVTMMSLQNNMLKKLDSYGFQLFPDLRNL
ncbi:relaxin receptor 1 [Pelobates cultripes]|uniref:Relaxin receptor 1 n=1 Tax=Pelobates cultripes TaxID=61616 RepID=A0AAD1SIP6_PELCU|nr:relaxin receptor 1 [Pelobates cultripes]